MKVLNVSSGQLKDFLKIYVHCFLVTHPTLHLGVVAIEKVVIESASTTVG